MRRWRHFVLVLVVLACHERLLFGGEILDRVVAVVEGHPILASEWDEAVRYECFQNQCVMDELSTTERQATLQRLIDQRLIEQEVSLEGLQPPSEEEITRKLAEMQEQILQKHDHIAERTKATLDTDANRSWEALLARYRLSEGEIRNHIARELTVLRFVDRRFRPAVQIEATEIERYYRETLMPELQKAGAADPPLEEVREQIRELLTQKAIDEQLGHWLQSLRQQGKIRMR